MLVAVNALLIADDEAAHHSLAALTITRPLGGQPMAAKPNTTPQADSQGAFTWE